MQRLNEEGETRTGCFSTPLDIKVCPRCGGPMRDCRCLKCGVIIGDNID